MRLALLEQLRTCCVQVSGQEHGCGFFIAPNLIVTCSHVVGRTKKAGERVTLYKWTDEIETIKDATILSNYPILDIAFIKFPNENSTYAPLSDLGSKLGNKLSALGFPLNGLDIASNPYSFDECSPVEEGYQQVPVKVEDQKNEMIKYTKFKQGQIQNGYSGGPLLNLCTGKVIGVVIWKNTGPAMGGWAIPVTVIYELLEKSKLQIPQSTDSSWEYAESVSKTEMLVEQQNLRVKNAYQKSKLQQVGSNGIYLMIQFPIIDLRPLLGIESLNSPRWESTPLVNQEFVHFFGEVRQRSKGIPGDLPWNDELFYATAKRALSFPELEKQHLGRFSAPQGGLRALYHDKVSSIVQRVEIGITLKPKIEDSLTNKDFLAVLDDFLHLPTDIATNKSKKNKRVRHLNRKQLVNAGASLSHLYQIATTKIGINANSKTVRPGLPVTFVLYKGSEHSEIPEILTTVNRSYVNNALVYYATFNTLNCQIGAWFIDINSASSYNVRKLRIGLSRLHTMRIALFTVFDAHQSGTLSKTPELVVFLEKCHGWLSQGSKYGLDFQAIQKIAIASDLGFPSHDLVKIESLIEDIRRTLIAA